MEDKYLWMSFVDHTGFRGVIITDELDMIESIRISHALDINPGGEVAAWETNKSGIKKDHLYMLMSKQDLIDYGYIDEDKNSIGDLLH